MSKLSLIDMTQDILSDMGDDEVNSISDTIESLQVAQIIKSTYFEIIDGNNWAHLKKLLALTASSDSERPTHMRLPDNVKELEWVEYDKQRLGDARSYYDKVDYVTPDEFLLRMSRLNTTSDNVRTILDYSGVKLFVRKDKQPEYWTSFDDDYIVFDSYQSNVETTVQSVNTRCSAYVTPTFQMVDSFIPDLPSEMFSALLAEAKSTAMFRLKDIVDKKAEQQSDRQMDWAKRKGWRAAGGIRLPSYARRSRK